jgi:hypothetical protein
MNRKCLFVLAGLGLLTSGAATAQGLKVVRPLPGYVCMSLTLTEEQLSHESKLPDVYATPSAGSEVVGKVVSPVFVRSPIHQVDGFDEILHLSGRTTWIPAQDLKPWRPMGNPAAKCTPSLMSNGRPGFDIH